MHELVQDVLSILLTTFVGFGVVILVEFYRWRRSYVIVNILLM